MSKQKICKYRNCKKPLDESSHGNRNYCELREGEPTKLSCKAREESLKKKEREESRSIEKEDKNKLRLWIEHFLDGEIDVELTLYQFKKKIYPLLKYFEKKDILNGKTLFIFECYNMHKWEVGEEVVMKLIKIKNDDKKRTR